MLFMSLTRQKKQKSLYSFFSYRLALLLVCMPFFTNAAIANKDFTQCMTNLKGLAETKGFSPYITTTIIDNISPIAQVIALDKKQPEFTESFQQYIKARVTSHHIKTGKQKLIKHKKLFDQLEEKYGVPRQFLVSFWGLETYFGKHKGKMSVLNSLATLACDQRRSEFFTSELFDLFTLIEEKTVSVEQLKGSWAGAMGHLQFMPSALLKYAIDGDNDGKVDIWHSEVDALTTAANYLNKIGWQAKERWGREVLLPKNFAFELVAFDQYYPLSSFQQLGVKKTNNSTLANDSIEAEIYLPSGYQGPAFLLYPNFNVIMTWNRSKSYALSVGILADKLQGENNLLFLNNKQVNKRPYSIIELKNLQRQLNSLGYETGKPDGLWGPKSRHAIRLFQLKLGLIADGYPNNQVFLTVKLMIKKD